MRLLKDCVGDDETAVQVVEETDGADEVEWVIFRHGGGGRVYCGCVGEVTHCCGRECKGGMNMWIAYGS